MNPEKLPKWIPGRKTLEKKYSEEKRLLEIDFDHFYAQHPAREENSTRENVHKFVFDALAEHQKNTSTKDIAEKIIGLNDKINYFFMLVLPILIYLYLPREHSIMDGIGFFLMSVLWGFICFCLFVLFIAIVYLPSMKINSVFVDFLGLGLIASVFVLICRHIFYAPAFPTDAMAAGFAWPCLIIFYFIFIAQVLHPFIDHVTKEQRMNKFNYLLALEAMEMSLLVRNARNMDIKARNLLLYRLERMAYVVQNDVPYFMSPADPLTLAWMKKAFRLRANWIRELKKEIILPGIGSEEKLANGLAEMFWIFYSKDLLLLQTVEAAAPIPLPKRLFTAIRQFLVSFIPLAIVFVIHLFGWKWLPIDVDARQWVWLGCAGWALFNMLYAFDPTFKDKLETFKSIKSLGGRS